METEHFEELKTSIEMAQHGTWLPMAIISGLFFIIILLLLAFWRKSEKNNVEKHQESVKRHDDNEKILSKLSAIVIRLEANDENKGREIGEIKGQINQILS